MCRARNERLRGEPTSWCRSARSMQTRVRVSMPRAPYFCFPSSHPSCCRWLLTEIMERCAVDNGLAWTEASATSMKTAMLWQQGIFVIQGVFDSFLTAPFMNQMNPLIVRKLSCSILCKRLQQHRSHGVPMI